MAPKSAAVASPFAVNAWTEAWISRTHAQLMCLAVHICIARLACMLPPLHLLAVKLLEEAVGLGIAIAPAGAADAEAFVQPQAQPRDSATGTSAKCLLFVHGTLGAGGRDPQREAEWPRPRFWSWWKSIDANALAAAPQASVVLNCRVKDTHLAPHVYSFL